MSREEQKALGKIFEGNNIIDMGWKNFAQVEDTGEIVTKDSLSFGLSSYAYCKDIMITHRGYSIDGYIDFNSVYHNGHHITSGEKSLEYEEAINGNPFVYLEHTDSIEIYEDDEVMKLLTEIYGEDFDIEELIEDFDDNWAIIKYADVICLVTEPMEDTYLLSSNDEENRFKDIFLSIYKARSFAELDQASFINMKEVDRLASIQKLEQEREHSEGIVQTEMASLLGIHIDTLYKLNKGVKQGDKKSKKKLNDYIELYLYKKYIAQ